MEKTAHELTRKEMKAPDRFQVAASKVTSWMAARKKQLAIVAVLVLAVLVFALAVLTFLDARRAKAGALLSAALTTAGGEVSATATSLPGKPVFKSGEEKARATLEAARKVREQASGSSAATTAALLEGEAQLALGASDEAARAFRAYLDAAPKDDALRFAGYDGLARALEGKGDLAGAAKTWDEAAGVSAFKDRAHIEQARVLAKDGKADEARKLLSAVPQDSPLQSEAQEKLARLGAK